MGATFDQLEEIRKKIAANPDVLSEAIARRKAVEAAAMKFPGAARTYSAGSVAHYTVNQPVTDADAGVVLDRRAYPELGPDGGGEGPKETVAELQALVGEQVGEAYPDVEVETHKRGLLVNFNEPLEDDQDPTVDMILTLNRKDADGLWIPNLKTGTWNGSHPEKHTELFTSGTKELRVLRARVSRIAKAWNCQWDDGDRALSSFNIQALAYEFVTDEDLAFEDAVAGWFGYAAEALERGLTNDPAGVSPPIALLLDKSTVTTRLAKAASKLQEALLHDDDPDAVQEILAGVFHDYVSAPANSKAAMANALRSGNRGVSVNRAGAVRLGSAGLGIKSTTAYGGRRDG